MPRYNVPRSKEFNDVYFSAEDGLAESRYVFLQGNNLPDAWAGRKSFTICETGFGTGLNFLAVLKLWLETEERRRSDSLHFISFEKYPLGRDFIENSLSNWGELKSVLSKLLSVYPVGLVGSIHDMLVIDGVRLTLIFGDMNDNIVQLPYVLYPRENGDLDSPLLGSDLLINCWFLDGFKPSNNPDMWSDILFENMVRLSSDGASFATFTVAGSVRRGLVAQGFEVQKIKGFGRKREMIIGKYEG